MRILRETYTDLIYMGGNLILVSLKLVWYTKQVSRKLGHNTEKFCFENKKERKEKDKRKIKKNSAGDYQRQKSQTLQDGEIVPPLRFRKTVTVSSFMMFGRANTMASVLLCSEQTKGFNMNSNTEDAPSFIYSKGILKIFYFILFVYSLRNSYFANLFT